MTTSKLEIDSGNTEEDWKIFDILCKDMLETPCHNTLPKEPSSSYSLDLITGLRSELAAVNYKRERLITELTDTKSTLCAKEAECESLKAQTARQSALIASLQNRLETSENRERTIQTRCDAIIETLKREKRNVEDTNKELLTKIRCLEVDLNNEENHKEQIKSQLHDFLRKLCVCLGIDFCEVSPLTMDCVVNKTEEIMNELHKFKNKMVFTCDALKTCENELLSLKSISSLEKQRMTSQIETLESQNQDLNIRCRNLEKDLHTSKDKITELEICNEKMRDELRGFESRCHRIQSTMDRTQNDRLQFLRSLASIIEVSEPCETLVKDKINEIINENQILHTQLHSLRDQIATEASNYKETLETANCRLKTEEAHRTDLQERLERLNTELQDLRNEHMNLGEFLVRLAKALSWNECTSSPAPGADTTILAESLLDKVERLAVHNQHHSRTCDKNLCDHSHHHHHHHHSLEPKLRRERSCHDMPLKEQQCSSVSALQRRIRVLREQVSRRDLHLELLRRKVALLEESTKTKVALQNERDDAMNRLKRSMRQSERLTSQLVETRKQITELKAQLAEAAEYKILSLEKARKIDEITARSCDLESDKSHLQTQVSTLKEKLRLLMERKCQDETLINTLRDDITRLKAQLADTNHRLSHLQMFRTSVARTLHLRDIPESDLLHRIEQLCNAYQEFTLLSKRYESVSPIGDHHTSFTARCDNILQSSPSHCHPLNINNSNSNNNNNNNCSTSPRHCRGDKENNERDCTIDYFSHSHHHNTNKNDHHHYQSHNNHQRNHLSTLRRESHSANSSNFNTNREERIYDKDFDINKKCKNF